MLVGVVLKKTKPFSYDTAFILVPATASFFVDHFVINYYLSYSCGNF